MKFSLINVMFYPTSFSDELVAPVSLSHNTEVKKNNQEKKKNTSPETTAEKSKEKVSENESSAEGDTTTEMEITMRPA
ncbi:MAG: hypothetical protein KME06_03795 [Kastovskya adunca ATA6-11-RM4]|jgi:hypothetical protein|nr:hypothetical protein [Kastovskya adunca ATA6-11-RM4]